MPLSFVFNVSRRIFVHLAMFLFAVFCALSLSTQASAQSFSGGEIIYIKTHHNTYLYMANGDLKAGPSKPQAK